MGVEIQGIALANRAIIAGTKAWYDREVEHLVLTVGGYTVRTRDGISNRYA